MAAVLLGMGFAVEKVINGNLDHMENAIIQFKKRLSSGKNACGFFFYAGHGVQLNGENYLESVYNVDTL